MATASVGRTVAVGDTGHEVTHAPDSGALNRLAAHCPQREADQGGLDSRAVPRLAAAAPDKLLRVERSHTRNHALPGLDVDQGLPLEALDTAIAATSSPHSPAEAESAVCSIGEEPRQFADVLGAEIADSVHRILLGQNPACVCAETPGFSFLNFEVAVAG